MREKRSHVPPIELTLKQIKEEFGVSTFKSATVRKCGQSYTLSLLTDRMEIPVLMKNASALKTWSRPASAVMYVKKTFRGIQSIAVVLKG